MNWTMVSQSIALWSVNNWTMVSQQIALWSVNKLIICQPMKCNLPESCMMEIQLIAFCLVNDLHSGINCFWVREKYGQKLFDYILSGRKYHNWSSNISKQVHGTFLLIKYMRSEDSSEPVHMYCHSLAYIKIGGRWMLQLKIRPVSPLDSHACMLKWQLNTNAISTIFICPSSTQVPRL